MTRSYLLLQVYFWVIFARFLISELPLACSEFSMTDLESAWKTTLVTINFIKLYDTNFQKFWKILEIFHILTIGKFSKIFFENFSPGFHKKICYPVRFDQKIRFPWSKIKKIFKGNSRCTKNTPMQIYRVFWNHPNLVPIDSSRWADHRSTGPQNYFCNLAPQCTCKVYDCLRRERMRRKTCGLQPIW